MSLLSEHDATQNSGLSWDPTGRLTAVDELTDSRISRSSFYKDVFRPAWKALEEAAATLLLEWFSGSLNTIGQLVNWYNAKQTAREVRYHQAHPTRHYQTPEALPIPLEAPIGLRKVMANPGETGNRGSFNVDTTESRKPEGSINPLKKTNPWLEATKKQHCILDINPPRNEKPTRKGAKPSKKSYIEEPNRGLDDIYTSPVNGFFAEEKDFSFKKPAPPVKKAILPKLNTQAIAALIDAELDQIMPRKRNNAAPEKPKEKSEVLTDGFFHEAELQSVGYPHPIDGREPHESEFIPGLPLDDLDLESQLENESKFGQGIDHQHVIEKAKPENGLPVPQLNQPQWSQPQLNQPKLNQNGASVMLAKAKAANLEFKRTMPVYQEMKTEMSGADHMVRNNRILHNSISNLADSYFRKAAQEEREQSNLY